MSSSAGACLVAGLPEPWITADDILTYGYIDSIPTEQLELLDTFAEMASSLAFELSGRTFPGILDRVVRPCRSACGCWGAASGYTPATWTWGWSAVGGWGFRDECGDKCGCGGCEQVRLAGYPVCEIVQVKIDGIVISPTRYRLDGRRFLTAIGDICWPDCQDLSLDDTQEGSFSIAYRWGVDPPELGRMAAAQLAGELWKAISGGTCKLPARVTRVVREGVTIDKVTPVADLLRTGSTGLVFFDSFMAAYNSKGRHRRPAVYSPDLQPFARKVGP